MLLRRGLTSDCISRPGLSVALRALIIVLFVNGSFGQDILFPDEPPSVNIQRIGDNASPKIECPANMTLAMETDDTEEYCECQAGNLYYPKLDRCFLQYTIGPCKRRQLFILRDNATTARCVRNPCKKKDTVQYKGSCYPLYVPGGPCDSDETLAVTENSNKPECVKVFAVNYQVITAPVKRCTAGSRRAGQGMCRQIL